MTANEVRRDDLYDFLAASADGVTIEEIAYELDCSYQQAYHAVRDLRLLLAGDDINVSATPDGHRQPWLYRLEDGFSDRVRKWRGRRRLSVVAQLRTIHAVSASGVKATKARTADGKRARIIEVGVRHIIENLDLVPEED